MTMVNILLIALGALLTVERAFAPFAGPFDVKLERFEECEEEGTGQVKFSTKFKAIGGGKYLYDAPVWLGVPIDEHFKVHIELQQWGNGGYKARALEHTIKNCEEYFKVGGDTIKGLMKSAGHEIQSCPVPAGNYTAHNWEIDIQLKSIPSMPYNKYRAIFTFFSKKVKVGCLVALAEAVPKTFMG